jgi:hypothetical protein
MKTRIIQTRFWDDEFISDCSLYTQHLYIYLLTSQYINICGIFQLPVKKILYETKLTEKQFEIAEQELAQADKVYFFKGWVFVKNAMKNNNYVKSSDNQTACDKELGRVPADVTAFFDSTVRSTGNSTSTVPINNKQETRNKNTAKKSSLKALPLTDSEIQELATSLNKTPAKIKTLYEKILDYELSTGKSYKDYKATIRNWLRMEYERREKRGEEFI